MSGMRMRSAAHQELHYQEHYPLCSFRQTVHSQISCTQICLSGVRKTYYEHNPFVFRSMKISALTVYNILNDLKKYNETFSSVAKRYYISSTTVASIFDSHVDMKRKKLPEMINFDEVYAFRSDDSKYVCMLLDFETHDPVDVLPSRRYDYLHSYFMRIPKEERDNVRYVCSDMYDCYRSIARTCFPNSVCIVDHFHLSQELGRRIDSVRIRTMKKYSKQEKR